jgi:hypothetical protein
MMFKWSRSGGYEVSSKGDKRFSPLFAKMPDGRSIEAHYQCDVKGIAPGSNDWKLGKGKPPLDPNKDLYAEFLRLWKIWANHNKPLIVDLFHKVQKANVDSILSDCHGWTEVNQARALADILNLLTPQLLKHNHA